MVSRQLLGNPRVGLEVAVNAPPYRGIRGTGIARLVTEGAAEMLHRLIDHSLEDRDARLRRWLLSRVATEVMIEIRPRWLTSWDFSRRMSQAVQR